MITASAIAESVRAAAYGRDTPLAVAASIDGFHRPRADRYRRGHDSPQ
jgi:hypothetical protein